MYIKKRFVFASFNSILLLVGSILANPQSPIYTILSDCEVLLKPFALYAKYNKNNIFLETIQKKTEILQKIIQYEQALNVPEELKKTDSFRLYRSIRFAGITLYLYQPN